MARAYDIVFYVDGRGRFPVLEFVAGLSEKEAQKCEAYIELLSERGPTLSTNYAKWVDADIWELRPEFGGTEFRLFYFTVLGDTIVMLHAIGKKTQRLARRDIDLARTRAEEVRPNE